MSYDCATDFSSISCFCKAHQLLELNYACKRPSVTKTTEYNMPMKTLREQNFIHDTNNSISQFNKILVVGLGQLGLPVAKYIQERGFETFGYDINPKAVEVAEFSSIKEAIKFNEFDAFILCVSTHKPDDIFSPQIDGLLSIIEKISKEAKTGALVSIESTISKGTSKKVFELLNQRLHVVHAPHRWYALEEKQHGVNQLRVIGGVCDCCLEVGMQFYTEDIKTNNKKSLGIPMHSVSQIEIAETTKIVENAHRYLQIAFAEELYLYCQENNMSFPELRDALSSKWNVNILEPREGIGGHCLPKDTKMFIQSSMKENRILTAATQVDDDYRRFRFNLEHELKSPIIEGTNPK